MEGLVRRFAPGLWKSLFGKLCEKDPLSSRLGLDIVWMSTKIKCSSIALKSVTDLFIFLLTWVPS